MKFQISVIIVHWNTPDHLKKLLKSLQVEGNLQITIVDNNSDKSIQWVKKEFPESNLIQNKSNVGYAKACNQGTRKSHGEWLVFLNPDVLITAKEIHDLIEFARKKRFDAFSPEPEDHRYKKPLPSGLSLLAEFTPLKYIIPLSFFPKKTLTGGALFIKNQVFKKLGGWDERFFLWFEDSDLTKRLYDGGYRTGWITQTIHHVGGVSFKQLDERRKREIFFSSMDIYAHKNLTIWGRMIAKFLKLHFT